MKRVFNANVSRFVAAAGGRLWIGDLVRGAVVAEQSLPAAGGTLNFDQIVLSPAGKFIGLVRQDGNAEIRDGQTLKFVSRIPLEGAMAIAWIDPSHAVIVSPLKLTSWNTASGAVDMVFDLHENLPVGVHVDPTGTELIVSDLSTAVGVYSLNVLKCKTLDELLNLASAQTP